MTIYRGSYFSDMGWKRQQKLPTSLALLKDIWLWVAISGTHSKAAGSVQDIPSGISGRYQETNFQSRNVFDICLTRIVSVGPRIDIVSFNLALSLYITVENNQFSDVLLCKKDYDVLFHVVVSKFKSRNIYKPDYSRFHIGEACVQCLRDPLIHNV
ncbi:hypothetical protein TWF102_007617 [Orbilia oligospora]|uniref:Uncharacterized protein n=1 Tax=Orbilia oligospora TaxID=2813651 RepID=A0A7C8JCT5_ORBOL|nr:hypothetical protein TWF102_007617 [Orbilia oligospora]